MRVYRWERCSLVLQMAASWAAASVVHWAETMDILTAEKTAAHWDEYWVASWVVMMVETMGAYSVVHSVGLKDA